MALQRRAELGVEVGESDGGGVGTLPAPSVLLGLVIAIVAATSPTASLCFRHSASTLKGTGLMLPFCFLAS
eukprot:CAMPEP_0118654694 /NCGR_PEP_ID=MMETSP0785-20121206/12529_1 /TAXON_ID=91992 /ORGANISM="Bolidomonas pacifica, Strain CCMP 1866" /LENGTH=70 /DNA_ID=CAMNT_0006547377 /DNA_START=177 /DNA_END=389 /DNA_ORIENTATION=-